MKQITMTLKKEWFDKILSGEKTIEYREYKPYWQTRLNQRPESILFRNGYHKNAPAFVAQVDDIEVIDGISTDLKTHGLVYAIKLKHVSKISA
jgi:ASC-1-like (ASCH) protein